MAPVTCPRCQRANPHEAVYCYFDGVVLRQGAAPRTAAIEFVFPSGRRCRNFDDLVQGCQYEWEDARELIRTGAFGKFLAGVGRMDLVRVAKEAHAQSDPDIGLHNFINALPVAQVQGPRLDLNPRRLNLGALRVGETREIRLSIVNQGKGLLQGKITVTEGANWLRIDEADIEGRCALKTARRQEITLRISTRDLPAPCSYSGKLTVITNGGIAEVPVRMDIGALGFPRPPFTGVSSPREMAERMRALPKQAVALLESGEIQKWFLANGWAYPVAGPTARGVASVQQFFEGMGLSKPPPLALSESELHLSAVPPEAVRAQLTLSTTARKWVYARVESDVPWLRVLTPDISGPQRADVVFEADTELVDPGLHEGSIHLTANAGQRHAVRVLFEVTPPHEPFTRKLLKPFFTGFLLILLYRILLAAPADLYARSSAESVRSWLQSPLFGERPRPEFVRRFVLATWWLGAVGGAVQLWHRGSRRSDVFCGAVAGAGIGVAGGATLACILDAADALPRAALRELMGLLETADAAGSVWPGTLVWVLIAALCWGLLGGVIASLLRLGWKRGGRILAFVAGPLVWLLQMCGLKGLSGLFES
jgi:hypothetical protein